MRLLFGVLLVLASLPASSQIQRQQGDLYVRVVDTGPGLCTITVFPDGYYMIYDAGHWTGSHCIDGVREVVDGEEIDLLVISHSDSDHLAQADDILKDYVVANIYTSGQVRTTKSWTSMNKAIGKEVTEGASAINLGTMPLTPGQQITFGDATVTFVAGWHEWAGSGPTPSEKRNALSIVVKVEYADHAILYTGDTIGRRLGDPDSACKDAEKFMVENNDDVPIDADVIIAPHHGGNNGSSTCFIEAVDPEFVIFSAGHDHHHPTTSAGQRYLDAGVDVNNIYRTDRGDDEGGFEWSHGRMIGCTDPKGDDDVEVLLPATGDVQVAYLDSTVTC